MVLDKARDMVTAARHKLERGGSRAEVVAQLRDAENLIERHYRYAQEIGYRYEIGSG